MKFRIHRNVDRLTFALFAILVVVGLQAQASATEADEVPNERIQALEEENELFRTELDAQRMQINELTSRAEILDSNNQAVQSENAARREAGVHSETPAVGAEDGLFALKGKFPMTLTGFLKGDMVYSDARLNSTSAPRFARAESGTGNHNDNQFTGTVQHSRIILKVGDFDLSDEVKGRAKLEMDFFNLLDTGDTNFNNNQLRVRQLYTEFEVASWTILIGQAWDVFSPLNVGTLNTNGNYWFGGNAGFRRPQLRVSRDFMPADGHSVKVTASVNSNIGVTVIDGGRTLNSGRDSGVPVIEGNVEYAFKLPAGKARVGVNGLWGQEDLDGLKSNVDQWAIGGYVEVPIIERLTVKGEIHHGENTDAFLMGGGINTVTGDAISSTSGWVQATAKVTDRLSVTGIFGIDDPDSGDSAAGARTYNRVIGANVKYALFKPFTIGLEYDHFKTEYKGGSDESASMFWLSGILNF